MVSFMSSARLWKENRRAPKMPRPQIGTVYQGPLFRQASATADYGMETVGESGSAGLKNRTQSYTSASPGYQIHCSSQQGRHDAKVL